MACRCVVAGILAAVSFGAYADVTVVAVNGTEDLIAKLWEYNGKGLDYELRLAPGDYCLPDAAMKTNNTQYGEGLSTLEVNKIRLVGGGESPRDVRLIGAGNLRVIGCGGEPWIENLTVSNGNATASTANAGYANRGGGVFGRCTVTNCVIAGCKASIGGAGQLNVSLYDCVVENNTATSVGGGIHNSSAYGTVFTNNCSAGNGGGACIASLYGCRMVGNSADGRGGGGYDVTYATNTIFSGNVAGAGGGGVAYGDPGNEDAFTPEKNVIVGCVISNNLSEAVGGGAMGVTLRASKIVCNESMTSGGGAYGSILEDCEVFRNVASKGNGGGYACKLGAAYMVSGCDFYANICSNVSATAYGGGIYGSVAVSNCTIRGNYAHKAASKTTHGGGAHGVTLHNCTVSHNYADYGGGTTSSVAHGSVFDSNRSSSGGDNAYTTRLIGCLVTGSEVSLGSAERTVFQGIGPEVTLDNPHISVTFRPNYVYSRYPNCTNCLFVGNTPKETLFSGVNNAASKSYIVNCTVASNSSGYMFTYFSKPDYPITVENTLFYGNSYQDISHHPNNAVAEAFKFSHCAYRRSSIANDVLKKSYSEDGTLYQFGTDWEDDPKFMESKDAAHPYSLKRNSPLIAKGAYADWMAGATDIRGEGFARSAGGSVDIGCYQCWLVPPGLKLSIR